MLSSGHIECLNDYYRTVIGLNRRCIQKCGESKCRRYELFEPNERSKMRRVTLHSQPKSLPLPLSSGGIGGRGGGDDVFVWRFGELIEAPKEASRRIPPAMILGEPAFKGDGRLLGECVGVPGRDVLDLVGVSPAAASVNRNSTHRRENDCGR